MNKTRKCKDKKINKPIAWWEIPILGDNEAKRIWGSSDNDIEEEIRESEDDNKTD
jgi:hypothetical protein